MPPKDANKPKGKMSAYAYFVQCCREEHKKKHPGESVVFTEFSRKCADRWKTMSDKEKKRFQEMADKDKIRYDGEMRHYVPAKGAAVGRGGKKKKDPNAPKRAMSAFFWFSGEERPGIREENPDWAVSEVAKELGRRWGEMSDKQKEKFEELSRKDRGRYEKDMKAYRAAPVPAADDSDEDESD